MNKIKLLALFGESCAGKDSIQCWLEKKINNTHKIISCTTRPKRDYEKDGKDYYFINSEDFLKKYLQDEILELTIFNNWYYGTPREELKKNQINIGVFSPSGIRKLLSYSDYLDILPVWIQTNDKTRLLRALKREDYPNCEEICRRFLADKIDFLDIDFDHEIFLNNRNTEEYYGFLKRPKIFNFISRGQN